MYIRIESYPGIHPELASEYPGVILQENTPGHVAAVETKIIDPNTITSANFSNNDITNTTSMSDDNDTPTPIFTINPTLEAEPDDEHEYSEDYYEDNYDDDENFEEVEPPQEGTPDPISI